MIVKAYLVFSKLPHDIGESVLLLCRENMLTHQIIIATGVEMFALSLRLKIA